MAAPIGSRGESRRDAAGDHGLSGALKAALVPASVCSRRSGERRKQSHGDGFRRWQRHAQARHAFRGLRGGPGVGHRGRYRLVDRKGGPSGRARKRRASPAISKAAPSEPAQAARGLKLPTRPPDAQRPRPASRSLRQRRRRHKARRAKASRRPRRRKSPSRRRATCTADVGAWPADSTDQAKAIQILLRDLGLYDGTTYGTVGPATRAAIRKFQLAAGETETGEPSETLFEQLKKKCASPTP